MKKSILALAVVSLSFVGCHHDTNPTGPTLSDSEVSKRLAIVPAPMKIMHEPGSYTFKEGASIAGNSPEVMAYAAETMHLSRAVDKHADIKLKLNAGDPSLGEEGYELHVGSDGVWIAAPKPAGLFYGVQTLRQIVAESPDGVLPAVHIIDKPRFVYRGLMLDSGRHIQSVQYVESLIDRMAELKMNRFHWHLTEDQGWRVEIKKYPKLTEVGAWREKDGQRYGGFFTQAEIAQVVAYADQRFVTIIPEIEMPGHSTAAVASYPWLGCTGKQFPVRWDWGISPHVYCPGKETTFTFCEDVLTEVMAIFPHSPVIHIGGDECPKDEWKVDPGCQAKMKELGLKDENALQGYFTSRIAHFLADHGHRLQGWNEIMDGTDLPKGVIVQQWNAPHSATLAAEAGLDVVISPTSHCYFDYPYVQIPTHKVLEFEPVPSDLKPELESHILGPQGNMWTEHMDDEARVDYMTFPRAVALSEVAWSPKGEKDWDSFKTRCSAWIDRQPEDQRSGLTERLMNEEEAGNRIGLWTPKSVSTTAKPMKFTATRYITSTGDYQIRLDYTAGAHGLAIQQVSLSPDGSTDTHDGFTGAAQNDRVYTVHLTKYDPAVKYVVTITARSDGGTDSAGTVYIKKLK